MWDRKDHRISWRESRFWRKRYFVFLHDFIGEREWIVRLNFNPE